MSEYKRLGDVANIIMGQSPKGDTYNKENTGKPLINGPTEFGTSFPTVTLFTTDSKRECEKGDLIFCVRGSTTGRMNWADKSYSLGRGVCSFRGENLLATRFIRYALEVNLHGLLQLAGGGTFPNLTKDTINDFKILFPKDYKKYALIANGYDNLIENNNRRIAILEEMAQSLYREWFVNFRYLGHADGTNNSENSNKPTLIDSPLGPIPEGWKVKDFSESFDFWNGKKSTKSEQGEFDLYGANGIVGKAEEWKYENAVIIGRVGAYCGAVEYCFDKFWGSDNTIIAKCKSEENISYLFLLLEHFNLNKYAGGSAQPLLTQTTLKQLKHIAPPEELISEFEVIAHKFYDGVVNLKQRNANLKKQRDMLLPKLISGQIELKD